MSARNGKSGGYAVGYGKPPIATRFKKGVSGNPKGRPKGARNFTTTIRQALRQTIWVTENGRQRRISKLEAAITQWVNRAAKGDDRAMRQLIALSPLLDELDSPAGRASASADQEVVAGILKRFAAMTTAQSNDQGAAGGDAI